ncbi:Iaa7p [Sarracenia purpurea var. burkii]
MEVGLKMSSLADEEGDGYSLNIKEIELCLSLPGGGDDNMVKITGKRRFSETVGLKLFGLKMSSLADEERDGYSLNLKEIELRLGLPGGGDDNMVKITGKRRFSETVGLKLC